MDIFNTAFRAMGTGIGVKSANANGVMLLSLVSVKNECINEVPQVNACVCATSKQMYVSVW